MGYSYADTATAALIHDLLAEKIKGREALDISGTWNEMIHTIRNLGRPGICSMAISAIDVAFWDLKAKIFGFRWRHFSAGPVSQFPSMEAGDSPLTQ